MKLSPLWMIVALAFAACGPGEKTTEFKELERILQDPNAAKVKDAPGASKPYREARQFRRLADEAWDEGNDELSREYAILGTLRYRTAEAMADQVAAKERLDAANTKVLETNPEIEALSQERIKLANEVGQLTQTVEAAKLRRDAMVQQQNMAMGQSNQGETRSTIIARVRDAETAQKQAEAVDAATHAPEKFNRALNMLKSVRTLLDQGQTNDQMLQQVTEATTLFAQARVEAQPAYNTQVAKTNPEERRAALRADATAKIGSENVFAETTGARLVLPELFATGSSAIQEGRRAFVTDTAALLTKYDEFTVFIEGYTSKAGNATENLGLSQNRARAIRDALVAAGVDANRIETRGYGQDRPRYADDARNERVEIVVSRTN